MASSEWLIKPFQSGGGIGTFDFDANHELPKQRDGYLQKRMPGETIGVTFLSSSVGSTFVGATAAWPLESNERVNRYVYRGSYGPIALSRNNIDKLQRFATIAGRESGLLGVWQADFLLHENELTLLEINPRWSASMDLLDVGIDMRLVQKHEMCARGMMTSKSLKQLAMNASSGAMAPQARMMGKLIVYASRPWIVTDAQSDLWWSNRWNMDSSAAIQSCQFADIPTAGTSISAGGPILTLMTAGDSKESMLKTLETERSHLRDVAG
jgi:predicted ATP-grasp superfamily ATP-dependent carboligase